MVSPKKCRKSGLPPSPSKTAILRRGKCRYFKNPGLIHSIALINVWRNSWKSKLRPRGIKSTKRAAHTRPRAPKTSPRGPQITHKSTFTSESSFYQKHTCYHRKIKVFEGERVRLGVRNRHREAPMQGKQRFGRRGRNQAAKHI